MTPADQLTEARSTARMLGIVLLSMGAALAGFIGGIVWAAVIR